MEIRSRNQMQESGNAKTMAPGLDRYGRPGSFLTAARLARGGWRGEGKERGWQSPPPLPLPSIGCSLPHPSNQEGHQGLSHPEMCVKDPSDIQAPIQTSPPACKGPTSIGALTHRLLLQGHVDGAPAGGRVDCKIFLSGMRETGGDRNTGCARETDIKRCTVEGRQIIELLMDRKAGGKIQIGPGSLTGPEKQRALGRQTGVVSIWISGCRSSWRQSRRLKAPKLPAIAEI